MTPQSFDPTAFGGQPSTPPIPMVVCWDDLDPTDYTARLGELGEWIGWLRVTYRIPATVIAPCWFTHPGIREDIGHLWTGWLLTRHPDAGVGVIGLDWDQRREVAVSRLREATAITGCTATRHQAEPESSTVSTEVIDRLWHEHLEIQSGRRTRRIAGQAVRDIVVDILHAAELRHDLASAILADITESPAAASDQHKQAVADQLRKLAVDALDRSARSANDAASTVTDAQQHSAREQAVADARADIADDLATFTLRACGSDIAINEHASARWLQAVEDLLPAQIAADRAATAAAARSAQVDQRAAARRHHPNVDELLE